MALQSVAEQQDGQQTVVSERAIFGSIPAVSGSLYQVLPDVPAHYVVMEAGNLANSIAHLAQEAVSGGGGMDTETAFLVEFAANAIQALMESIEHVGRPS